MSMRLRSVFSFPNPVNEVAARVVAGGVVVMCVLAMALRQQWLLVPLAYGFWARMLTGPTMSPLGQLATRVIVPRLPVAPRLVAGPPKRFAQAIGLVFSSSAVVLWFGFGAHTAAWVVIGLLAIGAVFESGFGLCLGCKVFTVLMRIDLVPDTVCEACADITAHLPELREPAGV
ncbi:MAG TPA: DUF4395 domain-containing protein [Acidimicrobiales bacterium]|nr:DUF4395 domain-containing protein [Acidimicrobiales bacterium]